MSADLEIILRAATSTVFATMLKTTPEFGGFEGGLPNGEEHVAGTVGFTGPLNGLIHFYSDATLARKLACRMLSMTDAEIEGNEMINDVIGELTNMLAGQVKVKLSQAGTHCLLTVPTVMRGTNLATVTIGQNIRKMVCIQCDGGKAVLEASIRIQK